MSNQFPETKKWRILSLLVFLFIVSNTKLISQSSNYCMSFDGLDDLAIAPTSVMAKVGAGDFTFETWLQGTESVQNTNPTIFSNRNSINGSGVVLFLSEPPSNGSFRILTIQIEGVSFALPNNGTYNASLLDGTCHHIAISKETNSLLFIIDGNFVGQLSISNPLLSVDSGTPLAIGTDLLASNYFEGLLWDIRIWNEARDLSLIQPLINTYLPEVQSELVANWQMNEGIGQITFDNSLCNQDLFLGGTDCNEQSDPIWFDIPCPLNNPFVDENCPQDIIHAEPFIPTQQVYQSANTIKSTAIIEQGEFIGYDATNYVELDSGFEVRQGALFEAAIGGCIPATPSCLNLIEPAEQSIVASSSPSFSWNISPSSLEACGPPFQYEITILEVGTCLLYTSPSPRDRTRSRMPSSA